MAARIRIVLNKPNIGKFLRSDQVANVLRGPAERIASAAGDGFEAEVLQGRKDRVIALITAETIEAKIAEREYRALTSSMDAGR